MAALIGFILNLKCGGGGIGRRTSLRGWRSQGRDGSSPFHRTKKKGRVTPGLSLYHFSLIIQKGLRFIPRGLCLFRWCASLTPLPASHSCCFAARQRSGVSASHHSPSAGL